MNDQHNPLRRLSTRGTTRGADDVMAAALHGVARRRTQTRVALMGAVVVIALGIVLTRPSPTADDTEIGPAAQEAPPTTTVTTTPAPALDLRLPVDDDQICARSFAVEADPRVAAEAAAALTQWVNGGLTASSADQIDDWEAVSPAVLAAAALPPFNLDSFRVEIDEPGFLRPDDICLSYRAFDGDALLFEALGAVVLVDGRWLVSRDTACALIAITGIECAAADPQPTEPSEPPVNPGLQADPHCEGDISGEEVPPDAVAGATAAVEGWLNTVPRGNAGHLIEDWDEIGDAVLAAADAAPLPLDLYRGEVVEILHGGSDLVCYEYAILNGDMPILSATGASVLIDGTWLVSRETVCAAIAVGGVDCPSRSTVSADSCDALYGDEPWVTLHHAARYSPCHFVAPHQRFRVFNKGNVPVYVDWPEGELNLGVDEFHDAGPASEILEFGENVIASDSISMPILWLLSPAESPLTQFEVDGESFGPITVGMTINEANAAMPNGFPTLRVHTGLLPGPTLWAAVFRGDPFSPIFEVNGEGDDESVIVNIIGVGSE